jgi:iron(III) transport system permease protein
VAIDTAVLEPGRMAGTAERRPTRRPLSSYATGALPKLGLAAFVAALAYLVVVPMIRLESLAFGHGARGYRQAYSTPGIGSTIRTTVELALGSLAIAMVLGTLLAFASTRLPRRLRILQALPILPIVVPAVASVLGWAFLFSPRPGYLNALLRNLPWWHHLSSGPVDVYTVPWIVIITGFGLTSFVYLFVSAGLQNINGELIEAAQVHGSSSLGAFFRVTLPLLRPVLVYGGGVALLLGLGQFTGPLLLGTNRGITVLTTDMYRAVGQSPPQYAVAAAFGAPLLLFGVAVVFLQKVVLGEQTRFVTHGGKAFRSGGKPSKLAAAGIILYSFVATVLPIIALVILSLSRFWSGHIIFSKLTLYNFHQIFKQSAITRSIRTGLVVSLTSVAIALPVGFIAASVLLKRRGHRIARTLIDFIVAMPLGIPAVIFGVGFLLTYTRQPFVLYGTRWVIILVYITLMLPFTTRMQLSGMLALGDSYVEASRVSGAGVLRTNLKIVLPLMRSTIGGASALMFVLLMNEFAASLLVRAPTTQVMGTVLFDYYTNGSYPLVACIALIMTLVTAVGVGIAVAIGGSDVFSKL